MLVVFYTPVLFCSVRLSERTEKEKLETDAMYKLDHGGKDKEKLRAAIPSLAELQEHQAGWKDDFELNRALRRKFRVRSRRRSSRNVPLAEASTCSRVLLQMCL